MPAPALVDDRVTRRAADPMASRRGAPRIRRVGLWSVLGLALLYGLLIVAGGGRAWSGSDAGGKVATVKTMAEQGSWHPDVRYWAEAADPTGRFHPLVKTVRHGDQWVQVTSLPMVYLAVPLWKLGGAKAILLLPAAGALLAALAARGIARNLGSATGWPTFWLVGLGGPVLFYAADFWEHVPALGLFLAAVAILTRPAVTVRAGVLAGLLAGLAVVLRAEMALYLAAFGLGVLVVGDLRRRWLSGPAPAIAAAAAAGAVFVANTMVERAVIGVGVQSGRLADQAGGAGAGVSGRIHDAFLTSVGLLPETGLRSIAVSGLFVAGIGLLGWAAVRKAAGLPLRWGIVLTVAAWLVRAFAGMGFVPGTVPTAPLAGAGVVGAERATARALVVAALAAVPLVWVLSWKGDLIAQWGGRYTLATGALLTIVGAVAIERVGWRQPAALALVGLIAVTSMWGSVWHVQRARDLGVTVDRLDAVPRDVVVVSTLPHLGREAGARYGDRRWLRIDRASDAVALDRLLRSEHVRAVDVVVPAVDGAFTPRLASYRPAGTHTVPYLLGLRLRVTRYVLAAT